MSAVFSLLAQSKDKAKKRITDQDFTVQVPMGIFGLGVALVIAFVLLTLGFTFFSKELPHTIFYVFAGIFIFFGLYLIFKTLCFKVIVRGNSITVYSIFRRPYTFGFQDIVTAVRQVKNNQVKSERIVVRTESGRKLIVERVEIGYANFRKKLYEELDHARLTGF